MGSTAAAIAVTATATATTTTTTTTTTGVVKVMGWWIGTRSRLADVCGVIVIVVVVVDVHVSRCV